MDQEKRLLSVWEAAQYLGVSHRTLWTWVQQGRIPHRRLGRRVLLDRVQLDALIDEETEVVAKKKRKSFFGV